jgi:hypothetical protein
MWHSSVMTLARGEAHRGGEREDTMLVVLTRILLNKKMKKIHELNSVAPQMDS